MLALGIIIALIVVGLLCQQCYNNGKHAGWLDGRYSGWKACEDLVLKRAAEAGHDIDVFKKLLQ